MANTSKLSETTKSMRKYLIGFLIFAIVVIIVQNLYHYIKNRNNPNDFTNSPYQFIDEAFGPVTYPKISSLAVADKSNPSFSVSGQFSQSPTSVNIYKTVKPKETLASVTKGQELATKLGITVDYQTNSTDLIWNTSAKQTLKYNKLTQKADYNNLGIDLNILRASKSEFLDIKSVESAIDSTLNSLNTSTIQTTFSDTPKLSYYLANGNSYKTTTNTENSDYIRKDYYPQYEIVSLKQTIPTKGSKTSTTATSDAKAINARLYLDNPDEGTTNITYANATTVVPQNTRSTEESRIREYHQLGFEVSITEVAVYKLEPIEQAWEDVKDGKGSLKYLVKQGADPLADYTPLNVKRFIVNPDKSELGFYITRDWTGYIYPVYIFRGVAELQDGTTADFTFFTKAVSN